ncbi:Glyoxalase family protein [Rubellimicrobium mesophilum DSM 19309]|uniref:Glyoxalase family protein n=1 Tax=Rubellimicrobium mesophilum DSM 19309 TaxID=442562 RepID=A0A017HTU0_9RHOB|nr:VOC family protein [Rubellimicrobium mesophilum]EYD77816.1 Glyoxalase family protein [Rubellimicrobium mesophilum DSM 19309]
MSREPPALILETAVYVDDLEAAEAFYGGVLGLPRIGRVPGRHAFYRVGAGVLLVFRPEATEVVDPKSPLPVPPHGARGPGHLCFAAEPLGLGAWRERLVAEGIEVEAEVTWPGGGRSFYFRDPAGNSLEVAEARIWDR